MEIVDKIPKSEALRFLAKMLIAYSSGKQLVVTDDSPNNGLASALASVIYGVQYKILKMEIKETEEDVEEKHDPIHIEKLDNLIKLLDEVQEDNEFEVKVFDTPEIWFDVEEIGLFYKAIDGQIGTDISRIRIKQKNRGINDNTN